MATSTSSCEVMANSRRESAAPLRQPEDRQEYRRSLHKSSSPHWKGAYREVRFSVRVCTCTELHQLLSSLAEM